jgi:hypothetical protein
VRGGHHAHHAHKTVLLLGACAALFAGCGGGTRQDANEPERAYTVATKASFPTEQSIVRPAVMTVQVHNSSDATVPNVAVTVNAFDYSSDYPDLADDKRPVWVIEQGPGPIADPPVPSELIRQPGGGQTAYVNTWALGALGPGDTRTFKWRVTPVKAGTYTVDYRVAAGLAGRAKAQLADGGIPQGGFTVTIAPRPAAQHINPNTGQLAPGPYPPPPYPTPKP